MPDLEEFSEREISTEEIPQIVKDRVEKDLIITADGTYLGEEK